MKYSQLIVIKDYTGKSLLERRALVNAMSMFTLFFIF